MNKLQLILGSSSPRRKEIIKSNLNKFKEILNVDDITLSIISPNLDERELDKTILKDLINIEDYPLILSKYKMDNILDILKNKNVNLANTLIITSDTSIIFNNKIYGKPKDKKENITFLKEFSSSTQKVISGFSIYYNNSIYSSKSISLVTFNKLEDSKINEYIEKIPTLDKAGGYSYQDDYKFHLINNIKGSTFNIIGLPLEDILDKLKDIN